MKTGQKVSATRQVGISKWAAIMTLLGAIFSLTSSILYGREAMGYDTIAKVDTVLSGPLVWIHSSANQSIYGDSLSNKMIRTTASVIIEDNIYTGGNCTILPVICIHYHSIVVPNSSVPVISNHIV